LPGLKVNGAGSIEPAPFVSKLAKVGVSAVHNIYRIILPILLMLVSAPAGPAVDAPENGSKIHVLFEVGGRVHDSVELPEMLRKSLEDTGRFSITITQDLDLLERENIGRYDVVMFYTTRVDPDPEQSGGLLEFVADGGGMVGIHASSTMGLKNNNLWKMMGGRFIKHGAGTFKVKITGKSHPIVRGMGDFEVWDETYEHEFCPDSRLVTLARRESDGEPVAWVQYYGKGRMFYTGLGHNEKTFGHPSFQEIIRRALLWANGELNP